MSEQIKNLKRGEKFWHEGLYLTFTKHCRRYGKSPALVRDRVHCGWDFQMALEQPSSVDSPPGPMDIFMRQPMHSGGGYEHNILYGNTGFHGGDYRGDSVTDN